MKVVKLKRIISLVIVFTLCLSATIVYAYSVKSNIPGAKTLSWYVHSTCSTSLSTLGKSAATTWNNASTGMTLSCQSTTSTGTITIGDSRSDYVWVDFDTISGFDSDAGGTTYTVGSGYTEFDIFMNSNSSIAWTNGSTDSKIDRLGVITHEFGHVLGLKDVYISDYTLAHYSIVPTMFSKNTYTGSLGDTCNNCAYYQRSLEEDDIDGVKYGVVPNID